MSNDLFAAPSDEELKKAGASQPDMFAPPNDHELKALEPDLNHPMPGEGFGDYMKRTYLPSLMQVPKAVVNTALHVGENVPVLGPLAVKASEAGVGYIEGDKAQQMAHEANQADAKQFTSEHPVESAASSLAGAAMLPAPFAGAKGLVGVGGRVLANTGLAAADQAAQGKDPIAAAELAGPMSLAGEALLGSAGAAAGRLSNIAEQRAVKAAAGNNGKLIKDSLKTGRIAMEDNGQLSSSMGRDMLTADEAGPAVVGRLDKAEDLAPKLRAKQQFYGDKIGEVGKQIDQVFPKSVSGDRIADKIEQYANSIPDTPSMSAVKNRLMDEAQYYKGQGYMSFNDAQTHKGLYQFKPMDASTQVLGQDATNFIKSAVSDEMDNAANIISESAASKENPMVEHLVDQYQNYKQKYGTYKTMGDAAEQRLGKDLSNRFAAPSDMGTGLAAGVGMMAGHSNPILAGAAALGAGAVNKFSRERGSAFSANIANDLSKMLSENPSALGQYRQVLQDAAQKGNANLGLTHYLLMKNDPQYQALMDQQQGAQ